MQKLTSTNLLRGLNPSTVMPDVYPDINSLHVAHKSGSADMSLVMSKHVALALQVRSMLQQH